jgi:DNA-binding MarR family transcriptional regulator
MEAFGAIRAMMPWQEAYAFLCVASEQGRTVQEYAKRVGVTQPAMTRILFALGSRGRGRQGGYGLVQQAVDTEDPRKRQTFLTAKGKAFVQQIIRTMRSDRQRAIKLQSRDLLVMAKRSTRGIAQEQWLSRLIAVGRKLDPKDVKLAVRQIEALVGHRQLKRIK